MNRDLWTKYEEYEELLFKLTEDNKYKFQPFDEQYAEYWFYMYTDWLEVTNMGLSEDYRGNKDEPHRNIVGRVIHTDLNGEITKAIAKVGAIMEWYKKEGLNCPEENSLVVFDEEWIAMEEGYDIRIEKWYDSKLEKIKSKFSQKEKSPGVKENWTGAIYTLADELREMKTEGKVDTYKEAYEYGEKYWTVKGKPVNAKQLEKNYLKARSIGKL